MKTAIWLAVIAVGCGSKSDPHAPLTTQTDPPPAVAPTPPAPAVAPVESAPTPVPAPVAKQPATKQPAAKAPTLAPTTAADAMAKQLEEALADPDAAKSDGRGADLGQQIAGLNGDSTRGGRGDGDARIGTGRAPGKVATAPSVHITMTSTDPTVERHVRLREAAFRSCYGSSHAKDPAASLIVTIDDNHHLTTSEVESYYNRPMPAAMLECVAKSVLAPSSVAKMKHVEAVVHVEFSTD